jgi:hypothetical protein
MNGRMVWKEKAFRRVTGSSGNKHDIRKTVCDNQSSRRIKKLSSELVISGQ